MSNLKMTNLKILVCGETGTGKTYFGLTFPKVAYIGLEPNGSDTAIANPDLQANIVESREFIPSPNLSIKQCFSDLNQFIGEIHKMGEDRAVETLFLDNMTYLAQNRWLYINEHEQIRSRNGELDTRGMYGNLNSWLYSFTLTQLLSFPGNVVVSCHEQREDEETLADRVDRTVPIVPNILGSFRTRIGGMFSANLSLEVKKQGSLYKFQARCQRGGQRACKNRYGLPEIVENISYNSIVQNLNKQNKTKQNETQTKGANQ